VSYWSGLYSADVGDEQDRFQWQSSSRRHDRASGRRQVTDDRSNVAGTARLSSRLRHVVNRYSPEPESMPAPRPDRHNNTAQRFNGDWPVRQAMGQRQLGHREGLRSRDPAAMRSAPAAASSHVGSDSTAMPVVRLRVSSRLQGLETPPTQQLLRSHRPSNPIGERPEDAAGHNSDVGGGSLTNGPGTRTHATAQRSLRSGSAQPQSPPIPSGACPTEPGVLTSSRGHGSSSARSSPGLERETPRKVLRGRAVSVTLQGGSRAGADAGEDASAYRIRRHSLRSGPGREASAEVGQDAATSNFPAHGRKHRSLRSLHQDASSGGSLGHRGGSEAEALPPEGGPSANGTSDPGQSRRPLRIKFSGAGLR
jgi:hypothetical protein